MGAHLDEPDPSTVSEPGQSPRSLVEQRLRALICSGDLDSRRPAAHGAGAGRHVRRQPHHGPAGARRAGTGRADPPPAGPDRRHVRHPRPAGRRRRLAGRHSVLPARPGVAGRGSRGVRADGPGGRGHRGRAADPRRHPGARRDQGPAGRRGPDLPGARPVPGHPVPRPAGRAARRQHLRADGAALRPAGGQGGGAPGRRAGRRRPGRPARHRGRRPADGDRADRLRRHGPAAGVFDRPVLRGPDPGHRLGLRRRRGHRRRPGEAGPARPPRLSNRLPGWPLGAWPGRARPRRPRRPPPRPRSIRRGGTPG